MSGEHIKAARLAVPNATLKTLIFSPLKRVRSKLIKIIRKLASNAVPDGM